MDSLKILFVEDLPTDYELAQWHLRKDELEFHSICVDTQPEFLEALDTYKPDLIISDYSMPEFNGLQALQLTLEHKPEIPFIILTGSINEETAVLCMKAGATDYVLKEKMHRLPFSVRETMKLANYRKDKILAERQLRASEEKFRDIFESANVGKAITTDSETISVNQAFADMLGYKREDLEKLPWQEITPPEDIKKTEKMVNMLHNGEADAVRYEKRYFHKNGSYIWVDISVKAHRDSDGNVEYFFSTIIDISERKEVELALEKNEERYRSLFQDSPVAIFEEDFSETIQWIQSYKDQGITNFRKFFQENPEKLLECVHTVKILNVNRSAVDLFNAKNKQELFLSLPLMAFVEDAQDRLDEFVNIAEGKTHFHLEIINNTLDKSRKYLSLHWGVVRGYEDDCSKVIVSLVDITDRKLSEFALKESETRFRNLFENSPVSIWEEDFSEVKKYLDQLKESGVEDIKEYFSNNQSDVVKVADLIVVSDVNQETLRLYGATSKEDLKQSISKIFTKKSLDQFVHQLMEISTGNTHFDLDFTNKTIDGRVLEFTAKWAAVPGYENDLSKVLISMIDITDRKLAEEALRENEKRYRSLFDDSPVAIFEEDFSAVKRRIDEMKLSGIEDFREFLTNHPEELTQLIRLIKITDLNKEAEKLYGLESKEGFDGRIKQASTTYNIQLMVEEFFYIANGFTKFQTEINRSNEEGNTIYLNVNWAAVPGFEKDLSKVIVSVVDISERRELEKRQQQRLAEMEAIDKITSALREASAKEDALPIFLQETVAMMQVKMGSIWLYQKSDESLQVSNVIGYPQEMLGVKIKPGEGVVGSVYLSGQTYFSSDFLNQGEIQPCVPERIKQGVGGVCLPIQSQEEILGVILILYPNDREVKVDEVRLLEAFARIAGITLQRMTLYEDTLVHLKQLQVQRTIDQTIASMFDLNLTLEIICSQARNYLNADAVGILLFHPVDLSLNYVAASGFHTSHYKNARLQLGAGPAGQAALDRKIIHVEDIHQSDPPFKTVALINEERIVSYLVGPLVAKGQLKGVLEIFYRTPNKFESEVAEFIESLGLQTAIAIDNLQMFEDLQHSNLELVQAYDATIEGWSRAMDLRDKETENHTLRVTEMTVQMARKLGLSEQEMVNMRRGALLHDIGKMGVPDEILHKPGPLTPEEWKIMKQHPVYAYMMIEPVDYLRPALDIPYCHHEKWDGSGYPRGLSGKDIPVAGRIFAVIDVWDALSSDRPYRKAWPKEKVLAYIIEQSGTHFDPQMVNIFLEIVESENGSHE